MRRATVLLLTLLGSLCAAAAAPLDGAWEGAIEVSGIKLEIRVQLRSVGDEMAGTIDIPQQGAAGLSLREVRWEADAVHFELPSGLGQAVFEGSLREDGTIAGTFAQGGASGTFSLARSAAVEEAPQAVPIVPTSSGELDGRWEGAISIVGQRLGIVVHLETNSGVLEAFIDIPQQAASGLPLGNVRHAGDRLHMELVAGPGLAVFDGKVEGDSIAGQFTQSGLQGTFELERAEEPPAAREPGEPAPYGEEQVTFANGDVRLAGTLTLPDGGSQHRAVVLIGGSGPQDRDSNVFGFPLFATLADRLARAGIAVLRYDDRGVGGSSGSTMQSTSEDFAGDAAAAVEMLAARDDIDGGRIGLLGISEGGLVAPMVAVRHPGKLAFLVLMAAPALDGQTILEAQAAALARAQGADEEDIAENLTMQRSIFAAVRGEKSWEQVEKEMDESIREALAAAPESERAAIADEDALVNAQIEGQLRLARTPWFGFFLDYDPAVTLRELKTTPVLALYGERDRQVPAEMNRKAMAEALRLAGNPGAEIRVVPGANHLFQAAGTGSVQEYATLPKEFAPGLLDAITGFILRQTPQPAQRAPR